MKKYYTTISGISRMLILLVLMGSMKISGAQNPIIRHIFTADPAPLVYHDTLFLYTGHDSAPEKAPNYLMRDYQLFSTTDMVNWKDWGTVLSPKVFSWAGDDAYRRKTS